MADQMALRTPSPTMTTADLLEALRGHYVRPTDLANRYHGETESDLLVEEVTAPRSNRRCDLLRIGIWESRGHKIIVHEIKTSRSDFLRELDDPAKAEAWWPYCHEFWIVAPDGLLKPEELPDGWGLMVPPANGRTRKFRVRKQATTKDPKLTPGLLVEIARRVDNKRVSQIANLNDRHRNDVYEAVARERQRRVEQSVPSEVKERLELLERFETAARAKLGQHGWTGDHGVLETITPEELGDALSDYIHGHVTVQRFRHQVHREAVHLARIAERATAQATKIARESGTGDE